MVRKYNLYQIDSFTKEKFTGNPAGVITNADGLNDEEMQKIAREINNSETAFIFSSNGSEYDAHIRFFTPRNEVPICGHATIAAHYARAIENKLDTSRVFHKTGAGILPVDGINKEKLLKALNIKESDLIENYKIQIVSTGHSKVMIGIKSINTLHSLELNYDELSKLSKIINCNGYYVFKMDSNDADILVHGRMFAPAIGINEDPVTGNANGPLGAYLVHYNFVKHNNSSLKFKAKQGEAINRSGIIEVEVKIEDNEPTEIKISGDAVVIFKSELVLENK